MMPLTPTTFQEGPSNELATADVYTEKSSAKINSIKNIREKYADEIAGLKQGGKWVKDNLPILKNILAAGKGLTSGDIFTQVLSGTSLLSNGGRLLPPDIQAAIVDNVGNYQETLVKMGDVTKIVKGVNPNNLSSVGGALATLTGKKGVFEIQDQDSFVGIASGFAIEGLKAGVPNSVGSVLGMIDNSKTLTRVTNNILPTICEKGDLDALKELGSFSYNAAAVCSKPDAARTFIRNFQSGEKTSTALATQVMGSLGAMKDVFGDFDTTKQGGEVISDIGFLGTASKDYVKAIGYGNSLYGHTDDDYYSFYSLGIMVDNSKDAKTQLKEAYPGVVTSSDGVDWKAWQKKAQAEQVISNTEAGVDWGSWQKTATAKQTITNVEDPNSAWFEKAKREQVIVNTAVSYQSDEKDDRWSYMLKDGY